MCFGGEAKASLSQVTDSQQLSLAFFPPIGPSKGYASFFMGGARMAKQ
jgi:hypothetical protein